jgi:hypothetical protein
MCCGLGLLLCAAEDASLCLFDVLDSVMFAAAEHHLMNPYATTLVMCKIKNVL